MSAGRPTQALLCLVFAASGASALAFEALFYRLVGFVVGNGVWAVGIVLCSYMAGIAVGSAWAGRVGDRLKSPVRLYALLELSIAASGFALALLLPHLPGLLASVFGALLERPLALNTLRATLALGLMIVPTAAMGATLPLLVRAISGDRESFGGDLGRLYGWNTLGAVAGVLITERWLVAALGVTGAAGAAASLSVAAGLAALGIARFLPKARRLDSGARGEVLRGRGMRLLAATSACGAIAMALEVVWFRLFRLFNDADSWNLAVMLAVVLSGIGIGGLAAAAWCRSRPDAHRCVSTLCFVSGSLVALSYAGLSHGVALGDLRPLELAYVYLMLPVALLSGVLFPLIAQALYERDPEPARATGRVAVANTLGGAVGALLGAFVAIPLLGIERSIYVLSAGYGVVGLLLWQARAHASPSQRALQLAAAIGLALALVSFPTGSMRASILRGPGTFYHTAQRDGLELIALREGVNETVQLYRRSLLGQTLSHVLATDGFSMSATDVRALRYMKLYVYWPMAVRPRTRSALLISYGVGSTARALSDTRSLERIDIVDISPDVLALSDSLYPDAETNPLRDPRVRVHVEDGRFFLQTTRRRFDLITGEPPPPRLAGVEKLYTEEFFQLVHARLEEGGVATYWLPLHQLNDDEAKAILAAFCGAFADCSLWVGAGLDWMMVGVRGETSPTSTEAFSRQWSDPAVAPELRDLGLLSPEQLGALFVADGTRLKAFIGDTPPLVDDHPHRIAPDRTLDRDAFDETFALFLSPESLDNFLSSPSIARLWPEALRRSAAEWFPAQRLVDWMLAQTNRYRFLHHLLSDPRLVPYLPWVVGSDARAQAIVARAEPIDAEGDRDLRRHLAASAIMKGSFGEAARLLETAGDAPVDRRRAALSGRNLLGVYLLLRAGDPTRAVDRMEALCQAGCADPKQRQRLREFWDWAGDTLGVEPRFADILTRAGRGRAQAAREE